MSYMKREIYNLSDEELAYLIGNLDEKMNAEKIPYIIVGGTAVQAQVLKRLHQKTGRTLAELAEDSKIRLQDYVRSTDDVDLAISSRIERERGEVDFAKKIFGVLESLAVPEAISPSGEYILGYQLVRKGIKRPVFQIYIDEETNDERRLALNIGRNPRDLENLDSQHYDEFIERGEEIVLPYNSDFTLRMRVIRPEHLLASKVSKFRAKDTMDIHTLADLMREGGEEIDFNEMRRLLLPEYTRNYERFLDLVNLEDPDFH